MRIRGDSAVLWRRQGESQIGTEPGSTTVLERLSDAEQQFLDQLPAALRSGSVYQAARRSRIPVARAREITRELEERGDLIGGPRVELRNDDDAYWDRLGADARSRGSALSKAVVGVDGTCALTQEIALCLAEAGVGTILCPHDPRSGGFSELLSSRFPAVSTRAQLRVRPDVIASIEPHVIEPLRARRLAQEGVAHLPVLVREVSLRVGPVLSAESGLCATCLDLWERDADPCWPALATQMRILEPPRVERLLLHQAATIAARAVLDILLADGACRSGPPGPDWGSHSVEITGLDPVGLQRCWQAHPDCLCSQLA
ncbi:hypothetical protein ACSL103130_11540 [Actinomyces slackii]|uniref:Bacteriocin biosynthesis cyclodehydratase domain n=1 Tax=Actinomyces slackii TaxID=52774 RepID=A0A448KCY8_9ACTO|nr:hypothetical protein [Actinomyces slackii]VEG74740.1 Uncharacterised protein [Actinomyces slackii]